MLSSFAPWCAERCISASEGESQKPHQGFAGQNLILHRGIEWSKSTIALGLPEWAGKTASGPAVAANNGPVVLKNPCQVQGRALPPGAYATQGQQANGSTVNFALDVAMGFPAGHYLDPQPLASGNVFQRQAYGNYTFGVYMAAAGVSLNTALSGANTYAFFFSSYSKSTPMDPNQGSLPAASVTNITNGYNAYANGTVCHN